MANENSEIRYLNPPTVEVRKKKYCRFKKAGIKYVDYKDPEFLKKFLNEQGKILPRRITGTSLKFQRKVARSPRLSSGPVPLLFFRMLLTFLNNLPYGNLAEERCGQSRLRR